MQKLAHCLTCILLAVAVGKVSSAESIRISSDAEHDSTYQIATKLVSAHLKTLEREPKLSAVARKELRDGIVRLQAVTTYNPRNWAAFWISGKASQALGDSLDANKSFGIAYRIQTTNADVAREYALSCIELGQGKEAVEAANRAIILAPSDAGLYANLALAYLIAKQNQEALSAINKALDINPNDAISRSVKNLVLDVISGKRLQPKTGADF